MHPGLRLRRQSSCSLLLPVALAATLISGSALAQGAPSSTPAASARLSGTVRTATGTPVAAARVTATNTATGAVRSAATDGAGTWAIANVPAGTYTVFAALVGYRRATQRDVPVTSGDATVDLTIEPIPLNAVTVTATLREEELKDVPFSIAAPTASELRANGAENIEDIAIT